MTDRVSLAPEEYERPKHWWQNPRWIGALAGLIFAIGNTSWALTTVATQGEVKDAATAFDDLANIAESNADAIQRLDENQAGIDELVAFVRDVQAQQEANGDSTSQLVNTLITLLCASEDPERDAACAAVLGEDGAP